MANTKQRVLVLEPFSSGHRAVWATAAAKTFAKAGYAATIATLSESQAHPAYSASSLSELGVEVIGVRPESVTIDRRVSTIGAVSGEYGGWKLLRSLFEACGANPADIAIVPYLDYCLHLIPIAGSPFSKNPWLGIVMRPTFHFREMGISAPKAKLAWLRRALFLRTLSSRNLLRCLTPDESLVAYVKQTHPSLSSAIASIADPIPDNQLTADRGILDSRLRALSNRTVILVFGTINARKGLRTLLRAAANSVCSANIILIIAGKQDAEARELLGSAEADHLRKAERLIEFPGWIDSSTERQLFETATAVWVAYEGHYQVSGVLAQAYHWGKPVIAVREGIVGWDVERNGTGCLFNPHDEHGALSSLMSMNDAESLRNYQDRVACRNADISSRFGQALLSAAHQSVN